jgi:tetratricopeptide (TPR) repeat protein
VIDGFTDENGGPFEFASPRGLFAAEDGRIHIADAELREVITINAEGKIINRIGKPESDLLGRDFNLAPVAVLEDQTGVIFILSQGCFQGALMIDPEQDNAFLGFYGASEVQMTLARMAERLWKMIFTREQRTRMAQFIPIEYTNFMIDDENFIYTCSAYTENNEGQIRKLNALGNNVMRVHNPGGRMNYGDPISYDGAYTRVTTAFVDITCDGDGFISALDRTRGRIFQYDEDSTHISVFGKLGDQDGCFTNPVAIESFGGKLCVLDAAKNTLTVFARTDYGNDVHNASVLYQDGRYQESLALWQRVLAQNANYELAYLGVSLGLAKTGQLEEALWYARQAERRKAYNDIFEEYRKEIMNEHFDTAATVLVVLGAGALAFRLRKRVRRKTP